MKLLTIFFGLIGLSSVCLAQTQPETTDTSQVWVAAAEKLIQSNGHYLAIKELRSRIDAFPAWKKGKLLLGNAFYKARDFDSSYAILNAQYVKKASSLDNNALFQLAQSAYRVGNFSHCSELLKAYEKRRPVFQPDIWNQWKATKAAIAKADSIHSLSSTFEMDTTFEFPNAAYADFSPLILNDSVLYFSGLRSDSLVSRKEDETSFENIQLFKVQKSKAGFDRIEVIKGLAPRGYEVANGSFSPDGRFFYFTRCHSVENGKLKCRLFQARVRANGKFHRVKALPYYINRNKSNQSQPFCTSLEVQGMKKTILFFVSDRKGGLGGTDIWYSMYQEKKKRFSRPLNAGFQLNTPGNESSPFVDTASKTMYFSTDFLAGFGGMDVFKSSVSNLQFSKPQNLGKPINSKADDQYFVLALGGKEGYLASNRKGSNLLDQVHCCEDVFHFRQKNLNPEREEAPILASAEPSKGIEEKIFEPLISSKPILDSVSIEPRKAKFEKPIEPIEKSVPIFKITSIQGENDSKGKDSASTVFLKVVSQRLKFKTGLPELVASSKPYLDSLAQYLSSRKQLKIKLTGHTDDLGPRAKNEILAFRRANAVRQVLEKTGVEKDRIFVFSKGEMEPLVPNYYKNGKPNLFNRSLNRRVTLNVE